MGHDVTVNLLADQRRLPDHRGASHREADRHDELVAERSGVADGGVDVEDLAVGQGRASLRAAMAAQVDLENVGVLGEHGRGPGDAGLAGPTGKARDQHDRDPGGTSSGDMGGRETNAVGGSQGNRGGNT